MITKMDCQGTKPLGKVELAGYGAVEVKHSVVAYDQLYELLDDRTKLLLLMSNDMKNATASSHDLGNSD